MSELLEAKPCPFCGEKSITVREGSTFRWMLAECLGCGATCGEVRVQTMGPELPADWHRRAVQDVVEEWNKRDPNIAAKRMKLYHATTQKKAKLYRQSGAIHAPVRGFTTIPAAMAWAMKVGRVVILEFEADRPHKLPDHHNAFGEAWWNDGNVTDWRCVFSAVGDA